MTIRLRVAGIFFDDTPMSAADLEKFKFFQLPRLVGGVVPVVRSTGLPGSPNGRWHLNADVLAAIFNQQITRWNHPFIAGLKPGVPLPALRITRAMREALNVVRLPNKCGEWVRPNLESHRAALRAGHLFKTSETAAPSIDVNSPGAWPIITIITIVTANCTAVNRSLKSLERAGRNAEFLLQVVLVGRPGRAWPAPASPRCPR